MSAGLVRTGAIYVGANVLSAAVPFMLLPILTRALDPAEYGVVVSFFMLVALCAATAGLSLQSAVGVRWLKRAADDSRRYTGTAIVLTLASSACTAAVAAAVAPLWLAGLAPETCAMAALVAGASVLQGMRFAVWQSCDQPLPAAALQVASATLNVALSLIAVFVFQLGGAGRIIGASLAAAIAASASVALLVSAGEAGRPSSPDARTLLRFGLPLVPHSLAAALLANADRLAVASTIDVAALGVYGSASQLGMVVIVLADAAVKAYTPLMYRMLARDSTRARLRIVAIALASIPLSVAAALALWMLFKAFGSLLLGQQYLQAIDLSLWFLLGGAASAVYLNIAGLFFFTGKTEWISVATVSATVFALLLATPAVARFGLSGGAATYVAAQLMLLAAAWALSRRVAPMPWHRPVLALRVLARGRRGALA